MAVSESNVLEEIRNCVSMYAVFADVGLLKKHKIKLTGWNLLPFDINVTNLWLYYV
jgi:hypothetical protein